MGFYFFWIFLDLFGFIWIYFFPQSGKIKSGGRLKGGIDLSG
jgi:hypothetical protein